MPVGRADMSVGQADVVVKIHPDSVVGSVVKLRDPSRSVSDELRATLVLGNTVMQYTRTTLKVPETPFVFSGWFQVPQLPPFPSGGKMM